MEFEGFNDTLINDPNNWEFCLISGGLGIVKNDVHFTLRCKIKDQYGYCLDRPPIKIENTLQNKGFRFESEMDISHTISEKNAAIMLKNLGIKFSQEFQDEVAEYTDTPSNNIINSIVKDLM